MGSVTSALTFDDYAELSHAITNTAVPAEEAQSSAVAGAPAEGEQEVHGLKKGETLDNTLGGGGAECSGGGDTTPSPEDGEDAEEAGEPSSTNGVPPPSADRGDNLGLGPARASMPSRLSSGGRETTTGRSPSTTAADVAASEGAGMGQHGSSGVDGATGGDGNNGEHNNGPNRAQRHTEGDEEGEGEGEGAAEWWREALGPTSRRPVMRRSLVSGGAIGGGTRTAGCISEQQGEGAGQRNDENRMVCSGDDGGSSSGGVERRRSRAAAPICGFSTESKHRNLEDFLKRRCDLGRYGGEKQKKTSSGLECVSAFRS